MINNFEKRLRRLEQGSVISLPWKRPPREWSDQQLMAVIGEPGPLSDERLIEISRTVVVIPGAGESIILGVPEAASAEEWIQTYAPLSAGSEHTERPAPPRLDS